MVIDTSALVAYLKGEPQAGAIQEAFEADARRLVSAATLVEAGIVVERHRGEHAGHELDLLLHRLQAEVVPVTREQADIARAAYRRFGKGAHPAGLNFGDCFSYALATALGEPLLYIGDDFSKTDVKRVL
ncbi:MAG TPA: type II toxin-antitoxin system VapC family toxin [Longimicrobium sp.]|nr:type II toxin-antitoxin system VapC family toxin [Longimicrobium sp.]